MLKVASYCRVSTDKEDQANSFESQQRYFRAYIDRQPDWELYQVYADEGITGTSTMKRAAFNRMITDAHLGKYQLILTKEVSRFSRNILDTITYTRELKALGVGEVFPIKTVPHRNSPRGSFTIPAFLSVQGAHFSLYCIGGQDAPGGNIIHAFFQLRIKLLFRHEVCIDACRCFWQRDRERDPARQRDLTEIHIDSGGHRDTQPLENAFSLLLQNRTDT